MSAKLKQTSQMSWLEIQSTIGLKESFAQLERFGKRNLFFRNG